MFEAVQQWMNENLTKDTSAKSRRCQLLAHHDAFADTLTSVYCGKNSYFPHLTTFTEDGKYHLGLQFFITIDHLLLFSLKCVFRLQMYLYILVSVLRRCVH